jgi:hypothetical protein
MAENSSELLLRRLFNVRRYFKQRGAMVDSSRVVIAEGEAVRGNGRIEHYLEGRLIQQVLFLSTGVYF